MQSSQLFDLTDADCINIINDIGGVLKLELKSAGGCVIGIVNDITEVSLTANYFCRASDLPKIVTIINQKKQNGLTMSALVECIMNGLIYENR